MEKSFQEQIEEINKKRQIKERRLIIKMEGDEKFEMYFKDKESANKTLKVLFDCVGNKDVFFCKDEYPFLINTKYLISAIIL